MVAYRAQYRRLDREGSGSGCTLLQLPSHHVDVSVGECGHPYRRSIVRCTDADLSRRSSYHDWNIVSLDSPFGRHVHVPANDQV